MDTPNQSELKKWLKEWDKLESYCNQEYTLNRLFYHIYPHNTYLEKCLLKSQR